MRKIKKIEYYIGAEYSNGYRVAYELKGATKEQLEWLNLENGQYKIPKPNKEYRMSIENDKGQLYIRKDLPKEEFSVYVVRRIPRYIEYWCRRQRYKREYGEALKVKIGLEYEDNGTAYICSPVLDSNTPEEVVLMYLNLFKNIFGKFLISNPYFKENIPFDCTTKWTVLQPGHRLFERENLLDEIAKRNKVNSEYIEREYRSLFKKQYTKVSIGKEGFNGYYVFEYDNYPFVIMEKFVQGNATYVIAKEHWEDISELSKTEVMQQKLYEQRILHNDSWNDKISKILDIIEENSEDNE